MIKHCDRPCSTCPFLTRNFGRPNPPGFTDLKAARKKDDNCYHDWYSEKNLLRLWRDGLRRGEAMICHSTDPSAASYGGINAQPGREKVCTGSLVVVFRHLKYLENLILKGLDPREVQRRYRAAAGKYPLTKNGQGEWIMNFAFGKIGYPFGLEIPRTIDGRMVCEISLPWNDIIVNNQSDRQESTA